MHPVSTEGYSYRSTVTLPIVSISLSFRSRRVGSSLKAISRGPKDEWKSKKNDPLSPSDPRVTSVTPMGLLFNAVSGRKVAAIGGNYRHLAVYRSGWR